MENPDRWTKAHNVINFAIDEFWTEKQRGAYGSSLADVIYNRLKEAEFLCSDAHSVVGNLLINE